MTPAITFRPLERWPHEATPPRARRSGSTFKAAWSDTLALVKYELARLDATAVILGASFRPGDIRLDGLPKAGAREPSHPGVELSFDSPHGRLVYATDVCQRWEHNIRSLGLGLEALRAVDRYGITQRGQQYAGFRELPSGTGGVQIASAEAAWDLLLAAAGEPDPEAYDDDDAATTLETVYRLAAKRTHPDAGGSPEAFHRVRAAYELLRQSA